MWRRPSPRQLPGGLAGCLCNGPNAQPGVQDLDEELVALVDAPSLEAAIAASDASMCKGRLDTDFKTWQWRDHAAEEGHQVLRSSTHSLSDMLTDEDWGFFSYELLLLSRYFLREGSPALDQVSALIPICRVRLGINSQLHHHIVELSRPAGSEAYSPLDVRYRASLLLRLWASWENFEYGTVADPSKEWTQKWIYMQLRVLKGCILERAMQLHGEGHEDLSACGRCLRAIRELTETALSGTWGKPQPLDRTGSVCRLLTKVDVLAVEFTSLKDPVSSTRPDCFGETSAGFWQLCPATCGKLRQGLRSLGRTGCQTKPGGERAMAGRNKTNDRL
ncbi:unnamed protein product [Symbiodinium natans]|uniref:Uncharacterized protein n=1 Tax=Symbiodinium natans TaxID=878477 RepID=A0A812R1K8_9DINO|nr:unnamed protein product [Symbiodinium natans]